ncbi:hypothetical protein I7I50_06560 [Histoplasma capsulatum G186AR]|uniref:Uncharacterized protein n=1 Tax=Ajellomyces capsulatus TaxID=5037 RepID=A0A8H7YWL2_AJECA|nr:hypothetical protein I7I52_10368 [Histoplasma capsulatum]QSS67466.1 hypothetical protein I7I50_06560 [Histoplasma capsulatum G186AR]
MALLTSRLPCGALISCNHRDHPRPPLDPYQLPLSHLPFSLTTIFQIRAWNSYTRQKHKYLHDIAFLASSSRAPPNIGESRATELIIQRILAKWLNPGHTMRRFYQSLKINRTLKDRRGSKSRWRKGERMRRRRRHLSTMTFTKVLEDQLLSLSGERLHCCLL